VEDGIVDHSTSDPMPFDEAMAEATRIAKEDDGDVKVYKLIGTVKVREPEFVPLEPEPLDGPEPPKKKALDVADVPKWPCAYLEVLHVDPKLSLMASTVASDGAYRIRLSNRTEIYESGRELAVGRQGDTVKHEFLSVRTALMRIIGPVMPVGETHADDSRLENLKSLIWLIGKLDDKICEIILENRYRKEESVRRAYRTAWDYYYAQVSDTQDFIDDFKKILLERQEGGET